MKGFVITSIRTGAGKTTLALGMALDRDFAYFKPLGDRLEDGTDEDYSLFAHLNINASPPIAYVHDRLEKGEVSRRMRKVSQMLKDRCVLVESPHNATYGAYTHLCSASIAEELGLKGIVVAEGSSETLVDKVLLACSYFESVGSEIIGVVLNRISYSKVEEAESVIVPALSRNGVKTFGTIPEKRQMASFLASDVLEHLGGKLLAGEKGLSSSIENISVGAMSFEHALKHFRKSKNKVVITGGDRADIQLAAMETSTSCLVLTGSLHSSPPILSKADELDIPVIMTKEDTYTTLKKVEQIRPHLKFDDSEKMEIIKNIVSSNVDIEGILKNT